MSFEKLRNLSEEREQNSKDLYWYDWSPQVAFVLQQANNLSKINKNNLNNIVELSKIEGVFMDTHLDNLNKMQHRNFQSLDEYYNYAIGVIKKIDLSRSEIEALKLVCEKVEELIRIDTLFEYHQLKIKYDLSNLQEEIYRHVDYSNGTHIRMRHHFGRINSYVEYPFRLGHKIS